MNRLKNVMSFFFGVNCWVSEYQHFYATSKYIGILVYYIIQCYIIIVGKYYRTNFISFFLLINCNNNILFIFILLFDTGRFYGVQYRQLLREFRKNKNITI